jgi:hypothetical protein
MGWYRPRVYVKRASSVKPVRSRTRYGGGLERGWTRIEEDVSGTAQRRD